MFVISGYKLAHQFLLGEEKYILKLPSFQMVSTPSLTSTAIKRSDANKLPSHFYVSENRENSLR